MSLRSTVRVLVVLATMLFGVYALAPSTANAVVPPAGYPQLANVGVAPGSVLATNTTGLYFNAPGTFYVTNRLMRSDLYADGPNTTVVVRNSRFVGPLSGILNYAVVARDGAHIIVEDSEFKGATYDQAFSNVENGGRVDFYRVWAHGGADDGFKVSGDAHIEDSYFGPDWVNPTPGRHSDAIQSSNGGVTSLTIKNNSFNLPWQLNSAVFVEPYFGNGTGTVVIEHNSFSGGGYSLYVVDGHDALYTINKVRVKNNQFMGGWQYGRWHSPGIQTMCMTGNLNSLGAPLTNPMPVTNGCPA